MRIVVLLFLLVCVSAPVTSVGCAARKREDPIERMRTLSTQPTRPDPDQTVVEKPLPVPAAPTRPVKSGSAPLFYLLEFPGEVRVVENPSGRTLLTTRAGGRTIVAVDSTRGISVGGKVMIPGPLKGESSFDIYLVSPDESVFKSGNYKP